MKTVAPMQETVKGEALIWQDIPTDMMWLTKEKEMLGMISRF